MPKRPVARIAASVRDPTSSEASISGGSSESEATAFAVAPSGPSGEAAVTTVTPVGRDAIALRNSSGVGTVGSGKGRRKYDAARVPGRSALIAAAAFAALALGACGSEGVQVPEDDPLHDGALLFSERCGGCHSLSAAGTTGSANRALRNQGPNLNERIESQEDVLYAIRNGGFSGAIMPQNIVVGDDAELVADFVAEYAGDDVDRPPSPASEEAASEDESGPAAAP